MLYPKCSRLFPLLTEPEHIHRFFILLLTLTATFVFWLESKGAPVTSDETPSQPWRPAATRIGSITAFSPATDPRLPLQNPVPKTDKQNAAGYPANYHLEKQRDAGRSDLFQMIYKKLGPDGRSGNRVRVEAGYGPLCRMEPDFGQRSLELEQPGCAYLKASLSF